MPKTPVIQASYGLYFIHGVSSELGCGVPVVFGRVSGWILMILAILMASAEAVMALGMGAYDSLATVDLWTLLVGQSPTFNVANESVEMLALVGAGVMQMPAWVVLGIAGFVLTHVCRKRRARRRVFGQA
jgi:hypothetical protein